MDRVKKHLALKHRNCYLLIIIVRLACSPKHAENLAKVTTIGICAGSGASVLSPVQCDLYLTGEMGHHEVLAAVAQNTSVILCIYDILNFR